MISAPPPRQIAAGTSPLAEEMVEDILAVPAQLVGSVDPADVFVLKSRGDSMAGPGQILDEDFVVVRRQQAAGDGDIITALLEDEATVKRLKRKNGRVRLMPDSPVHDPIPGEHAIVLGRVVAVMRVL
ncbi:LexA family protein [Streptacidiphilus monticola]|uniref:LexA family protein n=1 Tax=Streptacidiphilus monticola TaxID=2161674 RepID=A0ABW1G1J7_9ACTN